MQQKGDEGKARKEGKKEKKTPYFIGEWSLVKIFMYRNIYIL